MEMSTGIDRPFAPSSQRSLRLRAQSDLRRSDLRDRRSSVKELPQASIQHKLHGQHISDLLNHLDGQSQPGMKHLTELASDNGLLFHQSPGNLVELIAQNLSWNDAAYFFDASTHLIDKLEAIYSAGPDASCAWYMLDDNCKRLKDEVFLANLIHLLRRLQSFLFQILVRKCRSQVDDLEHQLHAHLELQQHIDKACVKEWPNGQHPLSTTSPWNIRPSLVILWGVCWMFYPSQQDGRRNARTQPPQNPSRFAFTEDWAENLPGIDAQQDIRTSVAQATYPVYTQAEMTRAEPSRSGGVAQHVWRPMNEAEILVALPVNYELGPSGAGLGQQWMSTDLGQPPSLYNSRSGNIAVPTTWPEFSGGNIDHVASQSYSSNVWTSPYGGEATSQAQLLYQAPSRIAPTLEVSPGTTFEFPGLQNLAIASRRHILQSHRASQDPFAPNMGETQLYPLSPRSDRQQSVPTSIASTSSALMSPEHSSPASESSRRPRATIKRARSPPRNLAGQIYCDHRDCVGKNVTFKRPCEWNKHMDKHDRPYKCNEPGCEQNPGFTYSGGLLRHQREVHKMHMSGVRRPLYCPFNNCSRSSGAGFTRRENLEEHKRRRHLGEIAESPVPVPTSSSPASTTHSMPPPLRKRRRTQETEFEGDDNEDDDENAGSDSADTTASQRVIKRLREDLQHRDDLIRRQANELARLQQMLSPLPPRAPATTA